MKTRNFPIGRRIAFGFAVPIALLIAISLLSLRNLNKLDSDAATIEHTIQVLGQTESLYADIADAESQGRGFMITGLMNYRQSYEAAATRVEAGVTALRALTADNPEQLRRIENLMTSVTERLETAREGMDLRENNAPEAQQRIPGLVNAGARLMTTIRAGVTGIQTAEQELLVQRRAEGARSVTFTSASIVIACILALLLVGGTAAVLTQSVTRPVAALAAGADRIGSGDYGHRVPITSHDEIGRLTASFNTMAAQIEERQNGIAESDWLKNQLAHFAALYQRNQLKRDDRALAETVLRELATIVSAPCSVLYRPVEDASGLHLELCAQYAAGKAPARLGRCEGLAGQCLADGKRIILSPAPADYLRVNSALGDAGPATIVVQPVVYENEIRAVIELASLDGFNPLQLEFLETMAPVLGITLQAMDAAAQTERLLVETQALASDLQSRQDELAEKNLELEEQTENLLKSERLLQEQHEELQQANVEMEQANEELQQANEEMEEKSNLLAEQKRELERSNIEIDRSRLELQEKARQLEVTSKFKSDFLANMSHELRTPLNSLLILARILAENREQNLTSKQVQYAETIESSGADLLDLINDILDLAKIESGTVRLSVDDLDPDRLSKVLDAQFRPVADAKGLDFAINRQPGLPTHLRTDVRRLQQVLKNLLSNAFKFTETGSVTLDISTRKPGVTEDAGTLVAFSVIDTGIGISADKQQIIFESFQQAEAGTSRRFGGTGLGLAISRELARLLGGTLEIQSTPGSGSIFTLVIPALAPEQETAAPSLQPEIPEPMLSPAQSAAVRRAPAAVLEHRSLIADDREKLQADDRVLLIIEDDVNFARILLDLAHEKHFKAVVAPTAAAGISFAREIIPTAITLDIRLADNDGWMVLDCLKHEPRTRHIPVHVISVEAERERGLRLGAISCLKKPVSKDAIDETLTEMVSFVERPVKNLLVVEDNDVQRNTICELIGNTDVHTTAVATAAEALQAIEKTRFDCVVMDLMLPDTPGVELIRSIHDKLGLKAPPVIIYTGKELTRQEETELRMLSETIIVKDAHSPERLLDETSFFLHRVQSRLPERQRRMIESVHRHDSVLSGRKALVVDDDLRNIFALTAALESYDMVVRFAESGVAALTLLQAEPDIDIVLMDVMMPEMDGHEATREIRKIERFASLPIISVTAKAMRGDRDKCIEAGASDYITKPVGIEKLASLMRVWLYR
ncbi:MAG: response regulator [Opitutaceae bacterium]